MLVVAGLSLKNLKPRVWEPDSDYYLPQLKAVMVSYADFHSMPTRRRKAMDCGIREYLCVPEGIEIYLDNGAFYFLRQGSEPPMHEYEEFVENAKPDWYPIPQDYIPSPSMSLSDKIECFQKTMDVNLRYCHDGFVPVAHISTLLPRYIEGIAGHVQLAAKSVIALGGIVPNLLRAPKAMSHSKVIDYIQKTRVAFQTKQLHVFGIGGTATLHLAAILGLDSIDSSGWRNRAARGIIQLPGIGDRVIANLGNWRGRELSSDEVCMLSKCSCPACRTHGIDGLRLSRIEGFCNRATHNLWVLLDEANWLKRELSTGSYVSSYRTRLVNSTYTPLITLALDLCTVS